ncbi:MAG: PAS domain S-box protein [Planctomycetota bacterium]
MQSEFAFGLRSASSDVLDVLLKQTTISAGFTFYARPTGFEIISEEEVELLRERAALYQAVADDQSEFLVRAAEGGRVVFANKRARDVFRVVEPALHGLNIYDFIPEPDDRAKLRVAALGLTSESPVTQYETRMESRDGSHVTVLLTIRGLFDSQGKLCGYQAIGRDTSLEKLQEARLREAQRMETLAIFSSGIANDMNNLLTPILGYADLISNGDLQDEEILEFAESIRTAGQRGAELVRQILTLSRPDEDGHSHLLNAADVIRETANFVRASIPATIDVAISIDANCGVIWATASQM